MTLKYILYLAIVSASSYLLTGCGQKGPLKLPEEDVSFEAGLTETKTGVSKTPSSHTKTSEQH